MKRQESKAATPVDPASPLSDDGVHILEHCPPWWDDLPGRNRSFFQSSSWGEYLERRQGYRAFYCYRKSGGLIKGTLLAYLAPVESAVAKLFKLNKLYWHQGPLLADTADFDTANALLNTLFNAAGGPLLVSGSPPYIDQKEVGELYPGLSVNFKLKIKKWATYLVDLSGGEEKAWLNLRPDARRLVNRMKETGYEVKSIDRNNLEKYLDLLRRYRESAGLAMPPFHPTEELLEQLGDDAVLLPGVFIDGRLCAVTPVLCHGDTCSFFGAAQEPGLQGQQRSISYLLHWNNLETACRLKLKRYDLAGVAHTPDTPKEEGIKRFKGKWGGEYVEYPMLEGGVGVAGRYLDNIRMVYRRLMK